MGNNNNILKHLNFTIVSLIFVGGSWWPLKKKKGRRKRTPQLLCWRRVSRGVLTWTFSLRESPQRFRSRVGAGDISTQLRSSVKYTHMNIHNNNTKNTSETWSVHCKGSVNQKNIRSSKAVRCEAFFLSLALKITYVVLHFEAFTLLKAAVLSL